MRRIAVVLLALAAACGGDDDTDVVTGGLDDGQHFGFITELDPGSFRLELDVAELLTGADARREAEAAGGVVSAGGSYVHNAERRAHRLTLASELTVRLLRPCCELHAVPFDEWIAGFEPQERAFYGTASSHYRVTIADGRVTAVDEVLIE